MGIIYGCQEGLVAMHKAGLTLSAAMATLIQVGLTIIMIISSFNYRFANK